MFREDGPCMERMVHVWRGWSMYRQDGPYVEKMVYVAYRENGPCLKRISKCEEDIPV